MCWLLTTLRYFSGGREEFGGRFAMRGSRKPKTFKVDIQRELLLTGCAIEETKRKARQREQHIKDLLARVQKSHEEKKKRNIGLHNRQNQQSSVKASLIQFPDSEGAEGAELRTLAPSRSSSRVDIRGVYTPKKPSSRCPSVHPPPRPLPLFQFH